MHTMCPVDYSTIKRTSFLEKKSVAVDFLKCHFFILHKLKSPPLYWSSGIHLRAHESAVWQVKKYVLLLTLKKTQHYWYCCKPQAI